MRGKLISKNALYEKYRYDYKQACFYEINMSHDIVSAFYKKTHKAIIVLQSYETIVGFLQVYKDGTCTFHYLNYNRHYSPTTAKQTTQFINDYTRLNNLTLKEYNIQHYEKDFANIHIELGYDSMNDITFGLVLDMRIGHAYVSSYEG